MRTVEIISVPYHAGTPGCRVGKGPEFLLNNSLIESLQTAVDGVQTSTIEPVEDFEGEIGRSFELIRRVSSAVERCMAAGRFPLVLAGNCNTTIGVFAGIGDPLAGVTWFDAHPDFDTPEEHTSGYFDGMGVATLVGQCWRSLAATIPNFQPLDLDRLIYCGIRDFEPGQLEKIRDHKISAILGGRERGESFADAIEDRLESAPFDRALIHVDLDCLDTSVGYANEYAAPGGLSARDLVDCMTRICSRVHPVAMTIASFNPDLEGSSSIAEAGIQAAAIVCAAQR